MDTGRKMMFPYVISLAALSWWKWVAAAEYVENASAQSRGVLTVKCTLGGSGGILPTVLQAPVECSAKALGSRSPRSMYFPASMFFNI